MKNVRDNALAELGLFDAYGIELEYMIVDRDSLAVLPVTDKLLHDLAGDYVGDFENGPIAWSNELALHVIEFKTNGPSSTLVSLAPKFQRDIDQVNRLLAAYNGRLMPTAMHPWMDPHTETRLWPHDNSPIYERFDRIFSCRGHGWSNLQSMHINLPFADDREFGRLHAAVRLVLPLLPALAASSPLMDGRLTGILDNRLDVYRNNAARIPSVSGDVIPEPVFSHADYQRHILERIYRDLAPHDPEGILRHEWVNARGAIARFDRHAIEIRVLDVQECPLMDISFAALIVEVIRALTDEAWSALADQQQWPSAALRQIFDRTVRSADEAIIEDPRFLQTFGFPDPGACRARELWQHLIETLPHLSRDSGAEFAGALDVYRRHGTLAHRIRAALGADVRRDRIRDLYRTLCNCLERGEAFRG